MNKPKSLSASRPLSTAAKSLKTVAVVSSQPCADDIFAAPMLPTCQCGQFDTTGTPILCPLHFVLPLNPRRPAMSIYTRAESFSPTAESPRDTESPIGSAAMERSYRFTPPMSLEDFPRPSSINRGESLATVLEERYQVSEPYLLCWSQNAGLFQGLTGVCFATTKWPRFRRCPAEAALSCLSHPSSPLCLHCLAALLTHVSGEKHRTGLPKGLIEIVRSTASQSPSRKCAKWRRTFNPPSTIRSTGKPCTKLSSPSMRSCGTRSISCLHRHYRSRFRAPTQSRMQHGLVAWVEMETKL